jgi:hypothetical protein
VIFVNALELNNIKYLEGSWKGVRVVSDQTNMARN